MKKTLIIISVLILVTALAYTKGFTRLQNRRSEPEQSIKPAEETKLPDTDSVEVVGVPTGDDPWLQMKQLVGAFSFEKGMQIKGAIRVIDDNGDQEKVLENLKFEYTGFEDEIQYRLGEIEYIEKKNFALVVDHESKVIGISPKSQKKKPGQFDIRLFKKLMSERNANARVTQLENEKILTIDHITDPSIQGYRIYYSPESFRINKILVGMGRFTPLDNQQPEVTAIDEQEIEGLSEYYYYAELTYDEIKTLNLKKNQFRPEEKFFVSANGRIKLKPEFARYELINAGQ